MSRYNEFNAISIESVATIVGSIANRLDSLAILSQPSIGEHRIYSIQRDENDFKIEWDSDPQT